MLSGLVGCGFLSEGTCSITAVEILLSSDGGLCGIMAVNWMAWGIFRQKRCVQEFLVDGFTTIGVIGYVVFVGISTYIIFHRMVTTRCF